MLRFWKSLMASVLSGRTVGSHSRGGASNPRPRARLTVENLESRDTPAVHFLLLYSNDPATRAMFSPGKASAARNRLEEITSTLGGRLGDSLQAGSIKDPANWLGITDPTSLGASTQESLADVLKNNGKGYIDGNGQPIAVDHLDLPADTIPVLVGLDGDKSKLQGVGQEITFSPTGATRQTGHLVPDFGTLHLTTGAASGNKAWDFGVKGSFANVVEHELGHILGFNEFNTDWAGKTRSTVIGGQTFNFAYFTGANVVAAFRALGGTPADLGADPSNPGNKLFGVPLDINTTSHWAPSPGDNAFLHYSPQQWLNQQTVGLFASGTTEIHAGMQELTQTRFTSLDYAALQDMGWTVTSTTSEVASSAIRARSVHSSLRRAAARTAVAPDAGLGSLLGPR